MPTAQVGLTVGGVWVSKRSFRAVGGRLEFGAIRLSTSEATSRFEHLATRIQRR